MSGAGATNPVIPNNRPCDVVVSDDVGSFVELRRMVGKQTTELSPVGPLTVFKVF